MGANSVAPQGKAASASLCTSNITLVENMVIIHKRGKYGVIVTTTNVIHLW
jgi:hypothetical protein